jgi:prepilin-type N-terminal cleavage/methylation domain-containing protein
MNFNLNNKERGFTIVELLIVIVVIGILAAISIVAYNGVQNRAKTSTAQSTAVNVDKKAEIYLADDTTTGFPATLTALTSTAAQTQTYGVPATSVTAGTPVNGTAPASANTIGYYKCGTGATTTAPVAPATNITTQTGVRIDYYDYTTATVKSLTVGTTSGTVGTYNIACIISNS